MSNRNKPVVCLNCKQQMRSDVLKRHLKVCEPCDTKIKCPQCRFMFHAKSLKRHMRFQHKKRILDRRKNLWRQMKHIGFKFRAMDPDYQQHHHSVCKTEWEDIAKREYQSAFSEGMIGNCQPDIWKRTFKKASEFVIYYDVEKQELLQNLINVSKLMEREQNQAKINLPFLEQISKDDIVLGDQPTFSMSFVKNIFVDHKVKVNEDEEVLIGDDTGILKVVKVDDDGKNKVKLIVFRSMSFTHIFIKLKEISLRTELKSS